MKLRNMIPALALTGALTITPIWADNYEKSEAEQTKAKSEAEYKEAKAEKQSSTHADSAATPQQQKHMQSQSSTANDQESARELATWIRGREDLTQLAVIIERFELGNLIEEGETYTLFLPNNDAFEEMSEDQAQGVSALSSPEKVEAFLRAHIARGNHEIAGLRDNPVMTLEGNQLRASRDLLLRSVIRTVNAQGEPVGENARIVDGDISVAGLTIHVIAGSLVETAEEPPRTSSTM